MLSLPTENGLGQQTPMDVALIPACVLQNLAVMPRIFRQANPESYLAKEIDLHMQLAFNVSVILNKRVKNPHLKAEMVKFLVYLVPQSFMRKGQHH